MKTSDLIHYYEVKMNAFSEYSNLVWNRFNWFITLQVVTFGFLFTQQKPDYTSKVVDVGVPIIAIIISILWVVMGVEDYLSLKRHTKKTKEIEINIKNNLYLKNIEENLFEKKRSNAFKQSLLLIIFPVIVTVTWGLILSLTLNKV